MSVECRPVGAAILIPTRGRVALLEKTFKRQPFLVDRDTWIGVPLDEYNDYRGLMEKYRGPNYIMVDNLEGSVAIARERLRIAALKSARQYSWFVCTDDNARYTDHSLVALIQSAESWQVRTGRLTFMAGMHSTAPHFDRGAIAKTKEVKGGWTTYAGVSFIFHAIPRAWYENYSYPPGCFALEDRHMMLSAIAAGHREFRVCMDAPYSKSRYQPGGQGDIHKRRWNCGRSIEQLAHDFPLDVGVRGTFPTPWQMIIKLRDGASVDRLMGGAMRKGDRLEVAGRKPVMIARRKRS